MTDISKAAQNGAGVHWFVAWRYLLARPRGLSGPILSVTALCLWVLAGFGLGISWFPLADELISPFAVLPWWLLISLGLSIALVAVWLAVIGVRYVIYSPSGSLVQRWLRWGFLGLAVASLGVGSVRLAGAGVGPVAVPLAAGWGLWLIVAVVNGSLSLNPRDAAPSMLLPPIVAGLLALCLLAVFDYHHRPYGSAGPEPIGALALALVGMAFLFLLISLPLVIAALRRHEHDADFLTPSVAHIGSVIEGAAVSRSAVAMILSWTLLIPLTIGAAIGRLSPRIRRYVFWGILGIDIALLAILVTGAAYGLYQVIWPARAIVPGGALTAAVAAAGLVAGVVGLALAVALRGRSAGAIAVRIALLLAVVGLLAAAVIGVFYVRSLAFSDLPVATRAGAVKLPLDVNIPMLVAGALLFPALILVLIRYFFTFFSTVSIGGVAIGTMALVIVLSVMSGFETDLRRKILGSNAHILVTKASDDPMICKVLPQLEWHRCVIEVEHAFTEYREVSALVDKTPGVIASSPYLISEVVIAANNNYANVIIKGVDPETVGDVSELDDNTETPGALRKLWPMSEDGKVIGKPAPEAGAAAPPIEPPAAGTDPAPPDFGAPTGVEPIDLSGGADPDADPDPDPDRDAGPDPDETPPDLDLPDDVQPIDLSGPPPDLSDGGPGDAQLLPPDFDDPALDPDDFAPPIAREGLDDAARELSATIPPRVAILPGVLVGRELVKQINLYDGQEVKIVSPLGQDTPLGPVPRTKPFRVAGVFFTGMYEYDLKFIYVELGALQDFLDLGDEVTGIEIRVTDPQNTDDVVAALNERLGPAYDAKDWKALNRSLFSALKLEKIAMFLVLAIIILVASFSIVGNLIMVVIEKAREIAVIKTLGASDTGVMKIFITQGFFIGLVGTGVGVSLGLAACWAGIRFGLPLDPDVYYIDKLPIHVDPMSVMLVAAAGIVISVVATLYPAYIAARLRPIHGLRYE